MRLSLRESRGDNYSMVMLHVYTRGKSMSERCAVQFLQLFYNFKITRNQKVLKDNTTFGSKKEIPP